MVLQRLRAATVHPDRERLRGRVEVDETFVGGVRHGRSGKEMKPGKTGKFIVVGAVEVRSGLGVDLEELRRPGRLRLRHVPDNQGATLLDFITDTAVPGSTIVTDGNTSYRGVEGLGFLHGVESTSQGTPQEEVLTRVHLAFSNLKTWLAGTFHGRVEAKHLQGYLNEFCFRFNRRNNLCAAFQTVLGIAPLVRGPTYADLYADGPDRFLHVREAPGTFGPAQVGA
jgi:transposase-like protein